MKSINESKDNGLSSKEVKARIKEGKVNGNYVVKTKSISQIIFTNVFTLFNLVNAILAVSIFLTGSYKNMLFLGVVFWNIFIGVFQEIRSKVIIDKLSILSSPEAEVIRDGGRTKIHISDIVLDDLLVIKSGHQICADSVIVSGECEVNESLITGESDPIYKRSGDEILSGSFITSGEVNARVIHVGKDNYVNTITGKAKYLKKPNSEMLNSIKKIVKVVSICLIPVTALLFINQYQMQGSTMSSTVVGTVAAVIGMIPSGLVLLTSMVLAVSVVRLSRRNTLVQELFCIETLARVDVLCLDKTGTITEGTMSVEQIDIVNENVSTAQIKDFLKVYCEKLFDDNPTFGALKDYAYSQNLPDECEIDEKELLTGCTIIKKIPFSSDKKWGALEIENKGSFVVGAMEYIFDDVDELVGHTANKYSRDGLRVLVLAHSNCSIMDKELPKGLKPIAIIAITDKIRDEAFDTIKFFRKQGVNVLVISGDNPETVSYIAKKAGVRNAEKYIDTSKLTDEELIECAKEYTVFGRVIPKQKLLLVSALKEAGHVVAMTGDGVNDVLALKEADCSIAMQSGSDAARNVSQLVLMDSNFSSMPHIVAEGRRTINNMQRSAALYLTKTIYSTIIAVLFVFVNLKYPFIPIQLTLVGALSIGIPSFILAMEPNVNRVKGKFMLNVLRMAIPGGLLVAMNIILVEIFGYITSASNNVISTMAIFGLGIAASVTLIKLCKPFNFIRRVMCASLVSIFAVSYLFMGDFFGFAKLNILQWIFLVILFIVSTIVFLILEVLVESRLGTTPNIYHLQLCISGGEKIIFVKDDVDRKDYYDVTAQMKGISLIGADRIVFVKEYTNDGCIRVESDDEINENVLAATGIFYTKKILKTKETTNVEVRYGKYNEVAIAICDKDGIASVKCGEDEIFEKKVRVLKKFKITF